MAADDKKTNGKIYSCAVENYWKYLNMSKKLAGSQHAANHSRRFLSKADDYLSDIYLRFFK